MTLIKIWGGCGGVGGGGKHEFYQQQGTAVWTETRPTASSCSSSLHFSSSHKSVVSYLDKWLHTFEGGQNHRTQPQLPPTPTPGTSTSLCYLGWVAYTILAWMRDESGVISDCFPLMFSQGKKKKITQKLTWKCRQIGDFFEVVWKDLALEILCFKAVFLIVSRDIIRPANTCS